MKILLTILFGLSVFFSFAQPVVQRSSSAITASDARGRWQLTGYIPHTHGLTLNGGLDTLGAVLYEDSSYHIWYRDTVLTGSHGHTWTMVAVGPPNGTDTIVIQNTGNGYPLARVVGDTAKIKSIKPGTNFSIDSVTTPGSYIYNASGGGGSQTLQQVFNTELGSLLTKVDTILEKGAVNIKILDSGSAPAVQIINSGTGGALSISAGTSVTSNVIGIANSGSQNSISIAAHGAAGGIVVTSNSSSIFPLIFATSSGNSSGVAGTTTGSSSFAVVAGVSGGSSNSASPGILGSNQSSINNSSDLAAVFKSTMALGDVPVAGKSAEWDIYTPSITNPNTGISTIKFKDVSTNVTDATYSSDYHIGLINSGSFPGTDQFVFKSSGQQVLSNYTTTTSFPVTAVGMLVYDASGNIGTQAISGGGGSGGIGIDSTVTITSGSSSTVTNGFNVVRFNPTSVITSYTLTLPTTWHTSNDLLIVFTANGTITSGNPMVTTLTIVNGSGQTLSQTVIPTTGNAGEAIRYHLVGGSVDQRIN